MTVSGLAFTKQYLITAVVRNAGQQHNKPSVSIVLSCRYTRQIHKRFVWILIATQSVYVCSWKFFSSLAYKHAQSSLPWSLSTWNWSATCPLRFSDYSRLLACASSAMATTRWHIKTGPLATATQKRAKYFTRFRAWQPFHFHVTTLGKLFTHVPLSPSSIIWYQSNGDDVLRLGR